MNNLNISLFPHSKTQVKVVNDLTPEMLRTHCVSVRLNHRELTKLNTLRGYSDIKFFVGINVGTIMTTYKNSLLNHENIYTFDSCGDTISLPETPTSNH